MDFFFLCTSCTYFHIHSSLLTFFLSVFVLFYSCCSHAKMFVKTHLHGFHISYSHTELSFLFTQCEIPLLWQKLRLSKLNYDNNSLTAFCLKTFSSFSQSKSSKTSLIARAYLPQCLQGYLTSWPDKRFLVHRINIQ